jgi:hypothetical protein
MLFTYSTYTYTHQGHPASFEATKSDNAEESKGGGRLSYLCHRKGAIKRKQAVKHCKQKTFSFQGKNARKKTALHRRMS